MKNLPTILKKNCVLGLWPWPQPFLSLASRGSVFESRSLASASDFFRVLGLEGCVLDSTSDSYITVALIVMEKMVTKNNSNNKCNIEVTVILRLLFTILLRL